MKDRLYELLQRISWLHVVLSVGAYAGYTYFMQDQSEIQIREEGLSSSKNEIQLIQKKLDDAQKFEQEIEARTKAFNRLVDELRKSSGSLPKSFNLPDLITEILKEAKKLEIEVLSIKPEPKETIAENYASIGFDLDMKLTYVQFVILLERLANLKRLLTVVSFSIGVEGGKGVVLGGEEGAFVLLNLQGGNRIYPGLKISLRVLTYRYKGSSLGGSG